MDAMVLAIPLVVPLAVLIGIVGAVLNTISSLGGGSSGRRKRERYFSRGRVAFVSVCGLLAVAGIVHLVGWGVYGAISVDPDYNKQVHGHTVNAYWANTPELMVSELNQAKEGLHSYHLQGDEYSTLLPWEQTPDNRMDYQYALIDSVIERAQAVKADRDRQQQQGTSDQLGDIYETKMDNLRDFIGPNSDGGSSGWLDETGHGAYVIHEHPYYAWWNSWGLVALLPWLGVVAAGIVAIVKAPEGSKATRSA